MEKPIPRLLPAPALSPGKMGVIEEQILKIAVWGCRRNNLVESKAHCLNTLMVVKVLGGKKGFYFNHIKITASQTGLC